MTTSMTMIMEMIEPTLKVGRPKEKGVMMPIQSARPTSSKLATPNTMDKMVPQMSPMRTDTLLTKPLPQR